MMEATTVFEIFGNIAAVIGAIISVAVYSHTVKREKKLLTIDTFSKIREKYHKEIPENERMKFLKEMEFFCVGINEGIYDINIIKKMSGKLLLEQYDEMKPYIKERRTVLQNSECYWCEYEKAMRKLQCMYYFDDCSK